MKKKYERVNLKTEVFTEDFIKTSVEASFEDELPPIPYNENE